MKRIFIRLCLFTAAALTCAACSLRGSTASPIVAKTLIPTRQTGLQLAPYPVAYVVTTRAGQQLQFRRILLEANEYVAFHTQGVPQGIPIASGVEVSFDYISQVDFDSPSPDWDSAFQTAGFSEPLVNSSGEVVLPDLISDTGSWPVSITLTNGSIIFTGMGFKAHHKIHLTGDSDYGFLDIPLADIQSISIARAAAAHPVPNRPPGKYAITVRTADGGAVSIAYPKLFATCMYDVYCCRGEDLTSLPLESADVPLDKIKSLRLSNQVASVTFQDGKTLDDRLRPSPDCPGIGWRLRGKAALGDFELPLSLVEQIIP